MAMLLEISTLTIRAGNEDAFAAAMEQHGMPILRAVPGVAPGLQVAASVRPAVTQARQRETTSIA
jgi:hypothetical protein